MRKVRITLVYLLLFVLSFSCAYESGEFTDHESPVIAKEPEITELELDEEEFEGFIPNIRASAQPNPQEALPTPETPYIYEIVLIALLISYGVNYFIGNRKNEAIARAWVSEFGRVLEEQFAHLGFGGPDKPDGALLLKESASHYFFYASGRTNCDYLLVTLELRQRQDLFSLLWGLIQPQEDRLTTEIGLTDMDPFIFAVSRCGPAEKSLRRSTDIQMCSPLAIAGLDQIFTVLSDCPEQARTFLTDAVKALLNKSKELQYLHVSDLLSSQEVTPDHQATANSMGRKALRVSLQPLDPAALVPLFRFQLYLIDYVATLKLPSPVRQRQVQRRQAAEEEQQRILREEAAKLKKQDDKEKRPQLKKRQK
eukprot:TRINITY_DN5648_c0_g1_i1.p2 TRINITY_DN5648_c0_g1~~TRINITY_DN5648_c0_g1_i1.p2  ORF type:complete len:368 (+),score=59.76 TRINITY_DN5648_c0_g1_i1:1202-2305(+)